MRGNDAFHLCREFRRERRDLQPFLFGGVGGQNGGAPGSGDKNDPVPGGRRQVGKAFREVEEFFNGFRPAYFVVLKE